MYIVKTSFRTGTLQQYSQFKVTSVFVVIDYLFMYGVRLHIYLLEIGIDYVTLFPRTGHKFAVFRWRVMTDNEDKEAYKEVQPGPFS